MGKSLQIALNALTVVSLVLAVLVAGLWVLSYAAPRGFNFYAGAGTQIAFDRGELGLMRLSPVPTVPHPGGGASGMQSTRLHSNFAFTVSRFVIWPNRQTTLVGYLIGLRFWVLLAGATALGAAFVTAIARDRRLRHRGRRGFSLEQRSRVEVALSRPYFIFRFPFFHPHSR